MFRARSTLCLAVTVTWAAATTAPAVADRQRKEVADKPGKPTSKERRLALPELLEHARNHARARAQQHAVDAATALSDVASGARFPRVEMTAFAGPSPDINCENADCTITSPENATVAFDGIFAGVRLQLAQPIYTFGKISAARSAAEFGVAAAEQDRAAVTGDLAIRTTQAYYGLKLARELRYMLEDGKEEIDRAEKQLEEAIEKGTGEITIQEKLRLQTLQAEVAARLTEAREAEAKALAAVRAVVGDRAVDIDEEPLEAAEFDLDGKVNAYIARAREKRPELQAGRSKAEGVTELARLERARFWPDLLLHAGVSVSRAQGVDDPPSAFANDPFNAAGATVGLVLRWKVDPVSQYARIKQSESRAKQASLLVEAATALADLDTERQYHRAAAAKERLKATRTGTKAARGWVASVLQADAIGTANPKDLADAYIAYFTMRARMLQTIYDWNVSTAELRRALGEFPTR